MAKPQFLYVEDDPASRDVMHILMTQVMDYPITIFEHSGEFLERLKALPFVPDVVFLDIHIYPLDGYQLLNILRGLDTHRHARIIAMTASVMALDVEDLKKAGFDGLIGKPIRNRIFPDQLAKILADEAVWYTG